MAITPHVGQNTSVMAANTEDYIRHFRPKLMVIMAGVNNQWALRDSNIADFLSLDSFDAARLTARMALDYSRLFRVLRYGYLRLIKYPLWRSNQIFFGGQQQNTYPPPAWLDSFAKRNAPAFTKLWEHDIRAIIRTAKANSVNVVLMSYHIGPSYLSAQDYLRMAESEEVGLVRNDLVWMPFRKDWRFLKWVHSDGWHPNKEGYALIANELFQYIVATDALGLGGDPEQVRGSPAR